MPDGDRLVLEAIDRECNRRDRLICSYPNAVFAATSLRASRRGSSRLQVDRREIQIPAVCEFRSDLSCALKLIRVASRVS